MLLFLKYVGIKCNCIIIVHGKIMDGEHSKIHINPAFLKKSGQREPKIHVNPSFMSSKSTSYPVDTATSRQQYMLDNVCAYSKPSNPVVIQRNIPITERDSISDTKYITVAANKTKQQSSMETSCYKYTRNTPKQTISETGSKQNFQLCHSSVQPNLSKTQIIPSKKLSHEKRFTEKYSSVTKSNLVQIIPVNIVQRSCLNKKTQESHLSQCDFNTPETAEQKFSNPLSHLVDNDKNISMPSCQIKKGIIDTCDTINAQPSKTRCSTLPVPPMSSKPLIEVSTMKDSTKYKILSSNKLLMNRSPAKSEESLNINGISKVESYSAGSTCFTQPSVNATVSFETKCCPSKYKYLSNNKLISQKLNASPNLKRQKSELKSPLGKYRVLSRNKLIRKSLEGNVIKTSANYKVLSKNKLIRRRSSSSSDKCKSNGSAKKCQGNKRTKVNTSSPSQFSLISRNKLIRSKSVSSVHKKSPLLKMKVVHIAGQENRSFIMLNENFERSKYAVKTRMKYIRQRTVESSAIKTLKFDRNYLCSKYKISRNKKVIPSLSLVTTPKSFTRRTYPTKFISSHIYSKKRNLGKSDTFINIDGSLYKSTKNSLRKQEAKAKQSVKYNSNVVFPVSWHKLCKRNSPQNIKLKPGMLMEMARRKKIAHLSKRNEQCSFFARTGRCTRNERRQCPYIHDKKKVAICTKFLMGKCSSEECFFSHDIDKNRMPACSHFIKGGCTRKHCPYRHVRVNPDAPVCLDFLQGNCFEGDECKKKHMLICEQFRLNGSCDQGRKCPLSHPKRHVLSRPSTPSLSRKIRRKSLNLSQTISDSKSSRSKQAFRNIKKGILGQADLPTVKVTSRVTAKQESAARYFNAPDALFEKKILTSPLSDNGCVELSKGDITSGDSPGKLEEESVPKEPQALILEGKRERMMRKVEKLKQLYTESSTIGSCGTDPSVKEEIVKNNPEAASDLKIGFVPLPEVMPSFIPLELLDATEDVKL